MLSVPLSSIILVAATLSCPAESDQTPRPSAPEAPAPPMIVSAEPPSGPPRWTQTDPRYGLLTPLPESGNLPAIYDLLYGPTPEELEFRARSRDYARQIRIIRSRHFGSMRDEKIRDAGLAELREFTDPAAFRPMFEELAGERDEIRLAVLDHFAAQGEYGQAALAWVATFAASEEKGDERASALRNEAVSRMIEPLPPPVLQVLDQALRHSKHTVANNAGAVAGALNVVQAIPLMIFAQVRQDRVEEQGDLAWILIGTQQLFVVDLEPVVGNGVVAFEPVIATVTEGVILRVIDAVAVSYRTAVHRSLVAMTTHEFGRSTEHLAYDPAKWWTWYNDEFVPHMQKKLEIARLAEEPKPRGG